MGLRGRSTRSQTGKLEGCGDGWGMVGPGIVKSGVGQRSGGVGSVIVTGRVGQKGICGRGDEWRLLWVRDREGGGLGSQWLSQLSRISPPHGGSPVTAPPPIAPRTLYPCSLFPLTRPDPSSSLNLCRSCNPLPSLPFSFSSSLSPTPHPWCSSLPSDEILLPAPPRPSCQPPAPLPTLPPTPLQSPSPLYAPHLGGRLRPAP